MEIKNKVLKCGFSMPELGFGTWPMGGYRERDLDNDDERDINAIKYAIDNGITLLDTAEIYAGGYSEELLGKAIKGYNRSKLMINSKVWGDKKPEEIKRSCINSLNRVGIDYFDIYYIHKRNKEFYLKDIVKAMEELVEEGLIKNIGVSNFCTESMKEAQEYCKYKIPVNQVHYNLIYREPEKDGLVYYCQQNDVFLVAWRPLELGKLAKTGNPSILEMSKKYGKSHEQIALNWLISQKNVVTLFKSSIIEHIDKNLGSIGWNMTDEDIEYMRKNYNGQIFISDSVPLG